MIIVNFSSKEYARAQKRLYDSLNGHQCLMFNFYETIGSPTHKESPYEFKIHAIDKGFERDPIVLWCDSSLWRVGDLAVIEKIISEDGFFATEAGHYAGRWTNEHTQKHFNVTDQEMHQGLGGITMLSAGLIGLNKNDVKAMEFLKLWRESAKAGCFRGDWQDHRHDQTCASIIATRLGLKYQRGGQYLSYIGPGYSAPEPSSIFYLQGM